MIRAAAAQLRVTSNRADNLRRAAALLDAAAREGASFVALPECFVGSYGTEHFAKWQESVPQDHAAGRWQRGSGGGGATMADAAHRHQMTVTGGVIEREVAGPALYNSMPIYTAGRRVATYRKVHLSRVLGITSESDVLTAGDECVSVEVLDDALAPVRVGMACCFDLRFAAFLGRYGHMHSDQPIDVLCAPSAFLATTGKDHWDLLVRRAALDGQCYVVAPNMAYESSQPVPLHGHSMIADPWGRVLAQCSAEGDDLAIADIHRSVITETRAKLPIMPLSRRDIQGHV